MKRCPEGQCTYERDHYEPQKVKESAQTTLWYVAAQRLYETQDFSHDKLVELVRDANPNPNPSPNPKPYRNP